MGYSKTKGDGRYIGGVFYSEERIEICNDKTDLNVCLMFREELEEIEETGTTEDESLRRRLGRNGFVEIVVDGGGTGRKLVLTDKARGLLSRVNDL